MKEKKEKIIGYFIVIIALLGIGVSIELLKVHHEVHSGKIPFCSITSKIDCAPASRSPQAIFLGVPLPVWALLYYFTIIWITISGIKKLLWKRIPSGILSIISIFGVSYSLYLFYIMVAKIRSICILCSMLDLFNISILILSFILSKSSIVNHIVEELKLVLSKSSLFLSITISYLLGSILLMILYPETKKNLPKKIEKKELEEEFSLPKEVDKDSIVTSSDYIIGDPQSPLEIIIFSDYQCPVCKEAHKELKKIIEDYKDRVKFVIKHFPLDKSCNKDLEIQMHPGACISAKSAICAKKFGKFFEMDDLLYNLPPVPDEAKILEVAKKLNLPLDKFKECLNSKETEKILEENLEIARRLKLSGTPSFIINREAVIPGWLSSEIFRAIIDELLEAK